MGQAGAVGTRREVSCRGRRLGKRVSRVSNARGALRSRRGRRCQRLFARSHQEPRPARAPASRLRALAQESNACHHPPGCGVRRPRRGAMKSSHLGLFRARCPASVSDAPTGWCTVTRSSSRPRRYSEKCLKPFGVPGEGGDGRQCEARRGRREEAPRARRRARFVGDARAGRCGSARSARDERLRTYPQTPKAERLRVELFHLAPDAS
jgi:hypothetical protein